MGHWPSCTKDVKLLVRTTPRPAREKEVPGNVIQLLVTVIQIYSFVLLARIVLSWIPNVDRSNQIIHFLYQITEPVLEPVRRTIPPLGMIDISPIVVFIGLRILMELLLRAGG